MGYKGLIMELIGEISESDELYLQRLYLIIRAHVRRQKKSLPIGGADCGPVPPKEDADAHMHTIHAQYIT